MKQIKKQETIYNAFIGPRLPDMTNQDFAGVKECTTANAAIVKDFVRKEKRTRLETLNEKISSISNSVSTSEYWDRLKNSANETSEVIQNTAKDGLNETRNPINKLAKSVKEIVSKSLHSKEKDLELLTKLAELKQDGIITEKEFDSKKRKILARI